MFTKCSRKSVIYTKKCCNFHKMFTKCCNLHKKMLKICTFCMEVCWKRAQVAYTFLYNLQKNIKTVDHLLIKCIKCICFFKTFTNAVCNLREIHQKICVQFTQNILVHVYNVYNFCRLFWFRPKYYKKWVEFTQYILENVYNTNNFLLKMRIFATICLKNVYNSH